MSLTINTLITIAGDKTKISTPEYTRTYSQNDTILIVMNGYVEIIDKDYFRHICPMLSKSIESKSIESTPVNQDKVNQDKVK